MKEPLPCTIIAKHVKPGHCENSHYFSEYFPLTALFSPSQRFFFFLNTCIWKHKHFYPHTTLYSLSLFFCLPPPSFCLKDIIWFCTLLLNYWPIELIYLSSFHFFSIQKWPKFLQRTISFFGLEWKNILAIGQVWITKMEDMRWQ